MALIYRMHQDADVPALARLWSAQPDWKPLDATAWRDRWMHWPDGESQVVVAVDPISDEIVGQLVFVPTKVLADGEELICARTTAAIAPRDPAGSFSLNPLKHPTVAMYRFGVEALSDCGVQFVYSIPDPNWVPFLKLFPALHFGSRPLFSRSVPDSPIELPEGFTARPTSFDDGGIDRLWESFDSANRCSVVKNARSLAWKASFYNLTMTSVERAGELVGVVGSKKEGPEQWLITDLVVANDQEVLLACLTAATNDAHFGARNAIPGWPITKVAALAIPPVEQVLFSLGYRRDDYDFTLLVHLLDPRMSSASVHPDRWWLGPLD